MLTLDELTKAVGDGSIDTVIVAFTDMQGRLMGNACTESSSSRSTSATTGSRAAIT